MRVRLLAPVPAGPGAGAAGDVLDLDGPTASELIREQLAVPVVDSRRTAVNLPTETRS